ncbi:MAG: SCO family protein [Pseudomonadota bacterium]
MQRIVLVMTGALCLIIVAAFVFLNVGRGERPAPAAALNIAGGSIGGPFTLVDHTGATRQSASVITGPTLIYFGYTFCPDVCPVDTQNMVDIADMLAEDGVEATPVFVTVDPERDDIETMAAWAEIMHPKMVALTGSQEQIDAVKSAYKVYAQRVDVDGEAGYLMNHSAYLYLADPSGVRAMYRNGYDPALIAEDIAWVLDGG